MTCAPRRVRRSRKATPSGASRRRFRIPKADVPPTEKAPAAIRRIGAAGAFPGPGPRWRGRRTGHDPRARGSRRCRGRLGPTARCRAPEARRLIPCRPTPGRGPHPTPSVSRSPWQSTKLPDGIRGRVRAVSTGPTNPPPGPPPHRDPKIATRDEPGGSSRTRAVDPGRQPAVLRAFWTTQQIADPAAVVSGPEPHPLGERDAGARDRPSADRRLPAASGRNPRKPVRRDAAPGSPPVAPAAKREGSTSIRRLTVPHRPSARAVGRWNWAPSRLRPVSGPRGPVGTGRARPRRRR